MFFDLLFMWFVRFQIIICEQKHLAKASCTELTSNVKVPKRIDATYKIFGPKPFPKLQPEINGVV